MSNRAYLYSSDRDDQDAWLRHGDTYYDSRWTVPLSWWFLFRVQDIRLVAMSYGGSSWHEIKFVADRAKALAAFDARRGLLSCVARTPDGEGVISRFFDTVGGWPGRYLLMDPEEVFVAGDEPEEGHHLRCVRILNAIAAGGADAGAVAEALRPYSWFEFATPDDFVEHVVGYTYA